MNDNLLRYNKSCHSYNIFYSLLFYFQNIRISLKSTKGPIEVFLCPEELEEEDVNPPYRDENGNYQKLGFS